jgi:hypothetical protein
MHDSAAPEKKTYSSRNSGNAKIIPTAVMNGMPVTGGLQKKADTGQNSA